MEEESISTPTEAAKELIANPTLDNAVEDEAQLDAVLASQGEVEPEPGILAKAEALLEEGTEDVLRLLIERLTAIEKRLEAHNVRSGHKI